MSDNQKQFWDSLYEKQGGACQSPYTKSLHEKLQDTIPSDVETILDAGCGGGALMAFLAREEKYTLEGVDISSTGVRFIVEEMHLNAQVGDLCDLQQFAEDSFDLVICSEVTEHIPMSDLEKVITELFRVARKYVIITNPFREPLRYYQVECTHCLTRYHPSGHIHSVDKHFIEMHFERDHWSLSLVYSGEREWHSSLFTSLLRACGYSLIGLEVSCPQCGSEAHNKKWGVPVRLAGYVYRSFQIAFKQIGIHQPANIITVAKVK